MLRSAAPALLCFALLAGKSTALDEVKIVTGESCGGDSKHILIQSSSDKTVVAKLLHTQERQKIISENSYDETVPPRSMLALGCTLEENGPNSIIHYWRITDAHYKSNADKE
jgi:hypothetical protein